MDSRDRTLLVIGWAAALRKSELVNLDVEHVIFTRDGLVLDLLRSKTDQKAEGQQVAFPYGSNPKTCPVRLLENWLSASGITNGPIFRRMDRHGNIMGRLTDQSARLIVKKHCENVGLDPKRYGAHSLRSGFCSTAAKADKAKHQIMKQRGTSDPIPCSVISKRSICLMIMQRVGLDYKTHGLPFEQQMRIRTIKIRLLDVNQGILLIDYK